MLMKELIARFYEGDDSDLKKVETKKEQIQT
jgi:hypothetical protein